MTKNLKEFIQGVLELCERHNCHLSIGGGNIYARLNNPNSEYYEQSQSEVENLKNQLEEIPHD